MDAMRCDALLARSSLLAPTVAPSSYVASSFDDDNDDEGRECVATPLIPEASLFRTRSFALAGGNISYPSDKSRRHGTLFFAGGWLVFVFRKSNLPMMGFFSSWIAHIICRYIYLSVTLLLTPPFPCPSLGIPGPIRRPGRR